MEFITFGRIFSFKDHYFVWLAPDPEEEKLYLAKILGKEDTRELIAYDKRTEKKHYSDKIYSPLLAYTVLTTEDFEGLAAVLIRSDEHAEQEDKNKFNWLGNLNEEDTKKLKGEILEGTGVSKRLIELIKNLEDND